MKIISFVPLCILLALSLSACISTNKPAGLAQQNSQIEANEVDPTVAAAQALLMAKNNYLASRKRLPEASREAFAKTVNMIQQNNWANASEAAQDLTSRYPNVSAFWVLAGDAARGNDAASEAINAYQQAIQANSDNYYAHNRLASLYRQQGQFNQAQAHYDFAIAAWPGFAPAYLNRGILNDLYLGEKAKALGDYQLYLDITEATQTREQHRQVNAWIVDLKRQLPDLPTQPMELVKHAQ